MTSRRLEKIEEKMNETKANKTQKEEGKNVKRKI